MPAQPGKRPAVEFGGGRNIAMKVPPHLWDATVRFYRDVVGLEPIDKHAPAVGFEFGANRLWIDRVSGLSQAEVWLELEASDIPEAAKRFESAGGGRTLMDPVLASSVRRMKGYAMEIPTPDGSTVAFDLSAYSATGVIGAAAS